jgi:NH3-dependent NAD+ synthetase
MTVNYLFAHQPNVLVVGTDHAAEAVSGFFTRYGDGGVDLTPLTGFNKQQGRSLTCCRQTSNCMMYPYNGTGAKTVRCRQCTFVHVVWK